MIFTAKSLIYTCATGAIGLIFFYIFMSMGMSIVGIIIALAFAAIGFVVGTFTIPENNSFEFTRKAGGEKIDEAILKWIKFKRKKNVIYTYTETVKTKEENRNG